MSFAVCDMTCWCVGIQHEEHALQKARTIRKNPTVTETTLAMQEINPAYICWLDVPALQIHLPVVQGRDDAYYLNHAWDNTDSDLGTPFFDCMSHREDPVQIIYGHSATYDKNAMFTPLHMLAEKEEETLTFSLQYETSSSFYEMAYAFLLPKDNGTFALRKHSFTSKTDFDQWISYAKEHTFLTISADCTMQDHYVILQTCSQNKGEFLIVIGRRCIA